MLDKEFAVTGEPGSHPVGTGRGLPAARRPAPLRVRSWVVPSARPWEPPLEAWPEPQRDTRSLKRPIRQERRGLSRWRPEWEPLAARRPEPSLARPWVVPSAPSREPPWAVLPELRLDTRPAKRSIRRRRRFE